MANQQPEPTYEKLVYVDRATTQEHLRSIDEKVVARALLAASLEDADQSWVFDQCTALADDPRVGVRWAVALAIGHLAIPGGFLNHGPAMEMLERLAEDTAVRPAALDARGDVEHLVELRKARPTD